MWLSVNVDYSHFSHFPDPFLKGTMLALQQTVMSPLPQPSVTAGTGFILPPALGSESLINFYKHMRPTQHKLYPSHLLIRPPCEANYKAPNAMNMENSRGHVAEATDRCQNLPPVWSLGNARRK